MATRFRRGMSPANFANPDLKWESTQTIDLGFDLSLFKNRIQLNFDYYVNTTKDLLYNLQLPATTGFSTMRTNLATIENRGWEIDFTSTNINRGGFQWTSSLNLSHNRNKILDLGGTDNIITEAWKSFFITKVGGPISQFYVFSHRWSADRRRFRCGSRRALRSVAALSAHHGRTDTRQLQVRGSKR